MTARIACRLPDVPSSKVCPPPENAPLGVVSLKNATTLWS